jgi:hypothetical protein
MAEQHLGRQAEKALTIARFTGEAICDPEWFAAVGAGA